MQAILKSRLSGSTPETDSAKLSPMNDIPLQPLADRSEVRRWSLSAVFVVMVHASVLAAGMFWFTRHNDFAGTGSQPMEVDLINAPPSPQPPKFDVAPGPEMQEAPAPAPEPEQQTKTEQEQIPPAPLQQSPVVVAPPEQKEKPKPAKDKPKPVVEKPPQPTEAPAPRTTAPPQAAQAARANYMGMLSAHLQRFKQYPPAARAANQQGTAVLSFTVSRDGEVSGSHITKSSGFATLDNETMAMLRRAQPLPAFPPEMTQSSLNFNAPIGFSLR
jgi:protein TonB